MAVTLPSLGGYPFRWQAFIMVHVAIRMLDATDPHRVLAYFEVCSRLRRQWLLRFLPPVILSDGKRSSWFM